MWNDIDLYHAVRDFTSDPVAFPGDEMRAFIRELVRYPALSSQPRFCIDLSGPRVLGIP
jgi:alpha-glucosidase